MERAISLAQTTVVRKAAMAASGVVIVGYLIGHVAGNLKIYQGPEAINEYGVFLRSIPALLWGTRVVLLAAFGMHIYSAFALWSRKNEARPVAYKRKKDLVTSYAARTMYWSGPILGLFVLYH